MNTSIQISQLEPAGNSEKPPESARKLRTIVCLLSAAYFAGMLYYAAVRPVDSDEGFYTTAARLVSEGKTPYRDFFYQQAPLLPYIYSWIWKTQPHSLLSMRCLSAAFGGAAVFLWGLCLISVKQLPVKVRLAAFAAILLNPYWVSWNVVVKTFSMANLMMSMATICFYAALRSGRVRYYSIGGAALGLCASVRSLYGLLIPFVVAWFFLEQRRQSKPAYRKVLAVLAGTICGTLPVIFSFARDPHAFIFNNISYHQLQAGYLWQDGKIVVGYQGLGDTFLVYFGAIVIILLGLHYYFTVTAGLGLAGGLSLLRLRKKQLPPYSPQDYRYFELSLLMLLVYTVTALIPFFPYDQYFTSPLVPFLIPFMAEGLRVTFLSGKRWVISLAVLAPLLFLSGIRRDAWEYSRDPLWQQGAYRSVAKAIEANSAPEDIVLSFWPGYVFESGRRYFSGLEDHFSCRIMTRITPETRDRYHVASREQIIDAVSRGEAQVLVIAPGECFNNFSSREMDELYAKLQTGYALVVRIDDVAVYRRRASSMNTTVPTFQK